MLVSSNGIYYSTTTYFYFLETFSYFLGSNFSSLRRVNAKLNLTRLKIGSRFIGVTKK